MRRERTVTIASELNAPASVVWARIGTMPGVNDELLPAHPHDLPARIPRAARCRGADGRGALSERDSSLQRHPDRLAFLRMRRVDEGRGFVEDSRSLLQRRWGHTRTLEALGDNRCRVTDTVTFTPRLLVLPALAEAIVGLVFRHRHRRLRRHYN
ncbi:MAG: hypothetical protein M5R36_26800 [Deltaproteobacteria bacterium]|nr:hypothetical protein [Deltaproteobacteria bacterium]